jgi:phosphopantetheinyl transferase (holo-ACP synthase)
VDLRAYGVIAQALQLAEIAEAEELLAQGAAEEIFLPAELGYARSKSDPARRLAARLAAKRAVVQLLGGDLACRDVEVTPSRGGPPGLALSAAAGERLNALGAARGVVSLTHGLTHAAAWVLLVARAR